MMQWSLHDVEQKDHRLFEVLSVIVKTAPHVGSPVVSTVLAEYVFEEI
jgi:hypothetical protein